jgi:hypothetical protein
MDLKLKKIMNIELVLDQEFNFISAQSISVVQNDKQTLEDPGPIVAVETSIRS